MKSNVRGVPTRRDLDVVRLRAPDRRGGVRQVRQVEQEIAKLRLHGLERSLEALDLVAESGHVGEDRRRVLALRLRDADLLAERVALRLKILRARLDVLALALERLETRGVERDAAFREAGGDAGEVLTQQIDVEHRAILSGGLQRSTTVRPIPLAFGLKNQSSWNKMRRERHLNRVVTGDRERVLQDERPSGAARHDAPVPSPQSDAVWGSDAIAAMLRALDIPYLALNPGASYRGLHDSIVNYLGNTQPQMLLCLHEESAVSIAQGYAKASDRMMGAVLHSNVGLMHATMSVFNAWCDRVPLLLIGATGPWDAAKRRPWIDWIHTAADQGALIRDYTKWDNQPASVPATFEALMRAVQIAQTAPRGPTYVNLDAAVQEAKLDALPPLPEVKRFAAPDPVMPAVHLVEEAARLLSNARKPVILMGRVSRSERGWAQRVALAEKLQAQVLTDLKMAAAFPTDHPLHAAPPGVFLQPSAAKVLREADVLLALDWNDLAGTLKQAWGAEPVSAKVIQVSPDAHNHRGWSMDYQGLRPRMSTSVRGRRRRAAAVRCGEAAAEDRRAAQGRRCARTVRRRIDPRARGSTECRDPGTRRLHHAPAAGLERGVPAFRTPARLHRLGRRRRRGRRSGTSRWARHLR